MEDADEALDVVGAWRSEGVVRRFVVGDDVDVVGESEGELGEPVGIVVGIVDTAEQDVLEKDFFVRTIGPVD